MNELAVIVLSYVAFVAFHLADANRLPARLAGMPEHLNLAKARWRTSCRTLGALLVAAALGFGWFALGAFVGIATTLGALMGSGIFVVLTAPLSSGRRHER